MLIARRRPWESQPQEAWPLELPVRPVLGWLGSVPHLDITTGQAWTRSASLTDGTNAVGKLIAFTGNTTNAFTRSGISTAAQPKFWFAALFRWRLGALGGGNFPQLLGTSTSNTGWRVGTTYTSGSTLTFGIVKGGVGSLSTVTLNDGEWYVAVGSNREDSGEHYLIALPLGGGHLLRTATSSTATSSAGNGTAGIGIARTDFAGAWAGDIAFAAAGFDFLPERPGRQLVDNLWAAFAPRRIWVPVSAGGSSVSLIVADATHGHTADGLALTSSTALSVAEATHAHAADNITLVVGSVLAIAEASHAHTADSLTLTAASALAVADAAHSHAADNITLSVAGATSLTVADALHSHAADALALTSAHALIVADATHGHTVDGLTLTAASVLAIQEALHAHAADNVTLDASGAVNLLLADGLHAHTADGVALTVAAWLTVADALHGHAADNVVLTFGGVAVEPLARYTITAAPRLTTITAAPRRLEINR